jgi:hypothetical protein
MADLLAWIFIIMVGGGLLVGVIGILLPLIIFVAGFFGVAIVLSVIAKLILN